jgi:AcrR family transcriptional regulator
MSPSTATQRAVSSPERISIRQQNKLSKRQQIKAAARAVFGEQGFDRATLRDIAGRADVALGTVLMHAQDKRDLVLLMYNDEIADLLETAEATIREERGFLESLLVFFRTFYRGYAENLTLARTYLQINFYTPSMNTATLEQHRAHKLKLIARIVKKAQVEGELRSDLAPEVMAKQILLLHRVAVRGWAAAEEPSVKRGIVELERILKLMIEGLAPRRR